MKIRRWILSAMLTPLAALPAFSQNAPARFSLEIGDKDAGEAQYQFLPRKDGFAVKGSYSFSVGNIHASCTREGELGPHYELKSDVLNVNVSGGTQEARFTAYPRDSRFVFEATVRGEVLDHSFPFYPRTAVLNDFDPSGVQGLLYLAANQPAGTQDYWVLVAKGRGIQSPAQLVAAAAGEGRLDGTKISLKHWQLTVGAVVMDIWADQQNLLMEAAVVSQSLAYRRDGFTMKISSADSKPAPPATNASADQSDVNFTSDGLKFPSILTLPKNRNGPVPIVVLVQGSGPHDADETIGPNKPFRDLAEGLAGYGIAALRYDKRTHFAAATFADHPDVEHETILDAVAALAFASSLPEIDRTRVFLLGHSLGGMVAPAIVQDRLQQSPGSVRGIIFLSAAALNIESTIERQVTASAARQGEDAAQITALRKNWEQTFARINDPATPADESLGQPPLQAPVRYWRSLVKQDPAAGLKQLGLPALVLRGTKDIQVSKGDYDVLAKANTAPGSENKEIAGLNHLFMPVAGESRGADYFAPAHVDPQVIRVIADWIGSLK